MTLFIVFLTGNFCFGAEEEKITVVGSQKQAEVDWMEKLRLNVSDTVFLSAKWFDSFFAEDEMRQHPPKVSARIRLGWEPKSGDLSEFKTRFRLRVRLPHFSNRMDLILSDDDQDEINQLPLEYVENDSVDDSDKFAAAVRFVHKNTDTTISDTRVGISSGDIFLRARYKRNYVASDRHAFKIQPSVYYYLNDGLGARLLTEYDYQINLRQQLRVNFSVRASESFNGVRWKHGLYHLNQFSLSQAGILGIVVEGKKNEENSYFIDKYALSYRYRFNAYRAWLFFEIEPFIEWPEERGYKTVPGIALRVEGYFNKS
jgi:hypothetical protein